MLVKDKEFIRANYDYVQNEKVSSSDNRLFSNASFIAEQINSKTTFETMLGE